MGIWLGVPRGKVYFTQFVDVRDGIKAHLASKGLLEGYWQAEGIRIDKNRNILVQKFLSNKNATHLLMIDSDMDVPKEAPEILHNCNLPIVNGLYFHRGMHVPFFMLYDGDYENFFGKKAPYFRPMHEEVYQFLERNNIPRIDKSYVVNPPDPEGIMKIDASGAGCLMIAREVLEQMEPPWFVHAENGTTGEDIWFFMEAKKMGIQTYGNANVVCGHYHLIPLGHLQFRLGYERLGIKYAIKFDLDKMLKWVAEFLGVSKEEVEQKYNSYSPKDLALEWYQTKPKTIKEREKFYKKNAIYILDLIHWNRGKAYDYFANQLKPVRYKKVLDFGGGIGSCAIQMAIQQNTTTYLDLPGIVMDFAKFRVKKLEEEREAKCEITWATSIDKLGKFDLIVAIDVLEHLKNLKKWLTKFNKHLEMDGRVFAHVTTPEEADPKFYPMHFDHSKDFKQVVKEAGFQIEGRLWLKKILNID